jgi:VanZ family protein
MPSASPAPSPPGPVRLASAWLPVLAYIGVIFSLSSLHSTGPTYFAWQDKVEHFLEYGCFGLLLARAFRMSLGVQRGLGWALGVVAFGSFVAAADEIYQRWVPGRDSDVRDWVADTTALIVAVLVVSLIARLWARTRGRTP